MVIDEKAFTVFLVAARGQALTTDIQNNMVSDASEQYLSGVQPKAELWTHGLQKLARAGPHKQPETNLLAARHFSYFCNPGMAEPLREESCQSMTSRFCT